MCQFARTILGIGQSIPANEKTDLLRTAVICAVKENSDSPLHKFEPEMQNRFLRCRGAYTIHAVILKVQEKQFMIYRYITRKLSTRYRLLTFISKYNILHWHL